ncbi:MAG: DUF5667 domain-containing protein [Candidatus Pacebacteria bacterium]|nr:DUF5667 domain-containing protein [Candidatus Paceibacterota bacterium]
MKNILLAALIGAVVMPGMIFAQSAETGTATTSPAISTGTLPDSPIYFVKILGEQIKLAFTFNAENKVKQYLHLAGVRLAEYQKLMEKGKAEIAQKTLDKYNKQITKALDTAKKMKEKGKDITDISKTINAATSTSFQMIQKNLLKAPEAAKAGLQNALQSIQKGIEVSGTVKPATNTAVQQKPVVSGIKCAAASGQSITLEDAKIAVKNSDCGKHGDLKGNPVCNSAAGTWKFNVNYEADGCSMVCSLNVATKVTDIEWNCPQ